VLLIACAVFWRDSDVTTYHSSRRSSNDRATVRVLRLRRRRDHGQCTVTRSQVTSHSNPVAYDNANVAPVRVHFIRYRLRHDLASLRVRPLHRSLEISRNLALPWARHNQRATVLFVASVRFGAHESSDDRFR